MDKLIKIIIKLIKKNMNFMFNIRKVNTQIIRSTGVRKVHFTWKYRLTKQMWATLTKIHNATQKYLF